MKGFILCVAVTLGIVVSNAAFGQTTSPSTLNESESGAKSVAPVTSGTVIASHCDCNCCNCGVSAIGMSQRAVKHTIDRGRCVVQNVACRTRGVVQNVWHNRPRLRQCRCGC